jgi:DNA-binding Xre family transcriptional regulator
MSVIDRRGTHRGVANERGVAYPLWEHIDRLLYERKLTQKWLVDRSGVSAMTINRLRTQAKPPKTDTIHALADALDLDHDEAAVLAGRLAPKGDPQVSVRDAVLRSDAYSAEQKQTLLGVIDALDAANQARRVGTAAEAAGEAQRAM